MFQAWVSLAWATSLLALKSQEVIALRMMALARGDRAGAAEAQLMMQEKFVALGEAIATTLDGGMPHAVVSLNRKKVRANRIRLAR